MVPIVLFYPGEKEGESDLRFMGIEGREGISGQQVEGRLIDGEFSQIGKTGEAIVNVDKSVNGGLAPNTLLFDPEKKDSIMIIRQSILNGFKPSANQKNIRDGTLCQSVETSNFSIKP